MAIHATGPSTSASTTWAVNIAAHPPRRRDLAAEPGPELRISGQLGPDGLYRHRPAAGGDAQEHPPHAALAKLSYQPVRPYRLRIIRLQFPGQS